MMVYCFHPSLCLPLNCARCFPILKRSFYKVSLYNAVYFNCKTYNLHQSFPSPISSPSVSHFVSVWTHNRPEDSPLLCSLELRSLLSYKEISLKCKSNWYSSAENIQFFFYCPWNPKTFLHGSQTLPDMVWVPSGTLCDLDRQNTSPPQGFTCSEHLNTVDLCTHDAWSSRLQLKNTGRGESRPWHKEPDCLGCYLRLHHFLAVWLCESYLAPVFLSVTK